MIKLIIFDFDGTVADTKVFIKEYLRTRLKQFNIQIKTDKDFQDIYLSNFYETLKKQGVSRKEIAKFKKKSIKLREEHALYDKIFPNVFSALKQLKKTSRLAIISSSFTKSMKVSLKKGKILKYFDAVLGAEKEEDKTKKIKLLIKRYKVKPSETAYVGDTAGDILEAKKAKVKSVAVSWGYHPRRLLKKAKPDILLSNPKQLTKVV
ncbi:HAD-IA family hydrolase [Candidatus Woesearchaeota archaeon]|nr:HAD-IA family hydrolase [Candidatus Woesearchaeota archaeon]